jgi:hypothetical protein
MRLPSFWSFYINGTKCGSANLLRMIHLPEPEHNRTLVQRMPLAPVRKSNRGSPFGHTASTGKQQRRIGFCTLTRTHSEVRSGSHQTIEDLHLTASLPGDQAQHLRFSRTSEQQALLLVDTLQTAASSFLIAATSATFHGFPFETRRSPVFY